MFTKLTKTAQTLVAALALGTVLVAFADAASAGPRSYTGYSGSANYFDRASQSRQGGN